MLKVSAGLVLLCGLLGSLGAQQLLNEVTQRLLSAGFLATAGSTSFQKWLNGAFYRNVSPQDLLVGLLFRANGDLEMQVKDTQLLQVSLEVSAASNKAYLRVPLLFSVVINSLTFNVKVDILVQLTLEKDLEDRYILAFRDCRLLPQFLQVQPENPCVL
uniref:putative BPIFA4P protein n=1 Tax=Ictidomys tridecemlineatus TaxID=43179 RepID=UPI001A9DB2F3|nr:putative BPIFA4P protein [Ictidomys tridecemlineatus]